MKKLFIILLMALTIPCFAAYLNNAFNSGELCPFIRYRVDLDKKYLGVETMENFLVKPQGAAVRRPGTLYVATMPSDLFNRGDCTDLVHTLPISNLAELQDMQSDLTGNYYLINDIDASDSLNDTGTYPNGFVPIGDGSPLFTGTLDGQGFAINDLYIDGTGNNLTYTGLFGSIGSATICNLDLVDCVIVANGFSGMLCGAAGSTTLIQGIYANGTMTQAGSQSGGLIGSGTAGEPLRTVKNCAVDVAISKPTATISVGLFAGNLNANYIDCYATGSLTAPGSYTVGGFIGTAGSDSSFLRCHVSGVIPAQTEKTVLTNGGFIGSNNSPINATFTDCTFLDTMNDLPFGGEDEGQRFTRSAGTPTGGTWTFSFDSITTGAIAWDADEDTCEAALDAAFGVGVIEPHGTSPSTGGNQVFYFRKRYSRTDVATATLDASAITGPESPYTFNFSLFNAAEYPTLTSGDPPASATSIRSPLRSNPAAYLVSFESATDDAYPIEAGNQYLRFYRTVGGIAGQIVDGAGDPYEIATVYDDDQVSELQYVQSNDVMYIVHPDDPPQKLIRIDHDDWTIADVDWEWGPFLDQNTTTTTITPSATTGTITLTASSAIFTADNVGSLWKIIEKSDNSAIDGTLDANGSSATVAIEGDGLLTLESTWTGLVTLEKSVVGAGSWEPVYPKLNGDAANIEYSFSESDAGYEYRVTMSSFLTGKCEYTLVAYNSDVAGYVEVTAFTSTTIVTATVTSTLAGTDATTKWAEGAWSTRRGYPRSICIYQNRLCLAGTTYQPNGFWTSTSFDLENMRESTLDNGAINEEISATKQNPILWLQDKNGVIAGTSGSVIRIFSQSNTSVLTPASFGAERQAEAGSADMQPALIGESIVFVDRNRRKVRDIIYDLQSDGFVSPELTVMAEHITSPGLIDIAVQNRPDDIVWFIRSDGQLISLTYNRNEGVVAWARHITDGEFESVCVIPGTDEDEIWVVVKRTIGGTDVRYIEQMQPQDWGTDSNNCWFVDSGLSYSGVATSTITGLDHLEGETLQAFYNGTEFENVTVSGGNVTLSESVTAATIGLPYTSTFLTFPIEMQTQRGFSVGYKKKVYEIAGCFYRTMNGQYGLKEQFTEPTMYDIMFDEWPDTTNGSEDPYTGQIRLEVDGGWSDEVQIKFLQEEPYPFNITAVQTKIEISEN